LGIFAALCRINAAFLPLLSEGVYPDFGECAQGIKSSENKSGSFDLSLNFHENATFCRFCWSQLYLGFRKCDAKYKSCRIVKRPLKINRRLVFTKTPLFAAFAGVNFNSF